MPNTLPAVSTVGAAPAVAAVLSRPTGTPGLPAAIGVDQSMATELHVVGNQDMPAPAPRPGGMDWLSNRVTIGLREDGLVEVFTPVTQAHLDRIRQSAMARYTFYGNAAVTVKDVYSPAEIRASQDVCTQALQRACLRDGLAVTTKKGKDFYSLCVNAGNTRATATVLMAGFVLLDGKLSAEQQKQVEDAVQAFAKKPDDLSGGYGGTGKSWSAYKKLDALRKTIGDVAKAAHPGDEACQTLLQGVLSRMMPELLQSIQDRFPGTDLQVAVTRLPRFINAESSSKWQELLAGTARDYVGYDQIQRMVDYFIRLPKLLDKADAPPRPAAPAAPQFNPAPSGPAPAAYPNFPCISNIGNPIQIQVDLGVLGKVFEKALDLVKDLEELGRVAANKAGPATADSSNADLVAAGAAATTLPMHSPGAAEGGQRRPFVESTRPRP